MKKRKKGGGTNSQLIEVESMSYLPEEILESSACRKYPIANMASLGVSIQPLTMAIQNVFGSGAGGSGFYYVDTNGMTMFKSGNKYIGSLKSSTGAVGGGQSRMTQIVCDPTMLFMTAALMNIEKQLGDIQEMQQEMMDFLKAKEKAAMRGDINTLVDILSNYKFNWDNETYKTNKHILVQDIRKEAEHSLQLYFGQIKRDLEKRKAIVGDQKVREKLNRIEDQFKDYQMALFLYSFASFLEVMLLENFAADYLDNVVKRIEEMVLHYRELYSECYNQLEHMSDTSVQSVVAKGVSGVTKGVGQTIGKIPVIKRGPVDEMLIESGKRLSEHQNKKTEKKMNDLFENAGKCSATFVDNILELKTIHNEPTEIYFDKDNLYLITA